MCLNLFFRFLELKIDLVGIFVTYIRFSKKIFLFSRNPPPILGKKISGDAQQVYCPCCSEETHKVYCPPPTRQPTANHCRGRHFAQNRWFSLFVRDRRTLYTTHGLPNVSTHDGRPPLMDTWCAAQLA